MKLNNIKMYFEDEQNDADDDEEKKEASFCHHKSCL